MYDLIEVKPKVNIQKICIFILVFILLVIMIIVIIKNKEKENTKLEEVSEAQSIQVASQGVEVQINNINKQKEQLINFSNLTDEQIQKITNIYNDTGEKRVFLTFDDGPSESVTPLILDVLQEENIKATFFLLGNRVEKNSEIVQRISAEGHYIANHGYSHQYNNIYNSIDSILWEYNKTEQCIQEALQNPNYHTNLFRFPGGSIGGKYHQIKQKAKEALDKNNIAYLDWNALSSDSDGAKTKEDILNNIVNTVGNKNSVVILMHDAGDKILTYETLPDVIKYLREQGYKFQNIYDLLK